MGNTPSTTNEQAKPHLHKLAAANMLVTAKCYVCRRGRTYLAADLIAYGFHPNAQVGELWAGCPNCGATSSWRERYRHASSADVLNRTVIRKLVGFKTTAVWRDEPYEAPARVDPGADKSWKGLI